VVARLVQKTRNDLNDGGFIINDKDRVGVKGPGGQNRGIKVLCSSLAVSAIGAIRQRSKET